MTEVQKPKWQTNLIYVSLFTILAYFALSHSIQHHKSQDQIDWKGENFADQSGYFIYNPIWFDYGYKSSNFPVNGDSLLGNGFSLSTPIVKNKYTCGVAYLQTPFYLWMKIDAEINNRPVKLNGAQTKRAIDVAAVFYALMGAICLYFFLIRFFKPFISFISILLVIIGTNVIYYAIYHPGMSHIYSFFLYSATLLLADSFLRKQKKWILVLFSISAACIILIRPTNVLFLPCVLFIRGSFKENILLFVKPVSLLIIVISTLFVFAPQMYYWYLFSGKLIYYSYSEEGFTHLTDPAIIRVLFAPENGLILYSLIYVLLLAANIYAIIKRQAFAIYYFIYQLIALYLIASWHAPAFGASYGQRNFVEIFAGLVIIFAFFLSSMSKTKFKIGLYFMLLISIFFGLFNLKIISRYDYAFFGKSPWDWKEYKYFTSFANYTIKQNFDTFYKPEYISKQKNNNVLEMNADREYAKMFECNYDALPDYFKVAKFSMDAKSSQKEIMFDCCLKVYNTDTTLLQTAVPIRFTKLKKNSWKKSVAKLHIKRLNDLEFSNVKLSVYLWNKEHSQFSIDNVKMVIE